ncbi:MAG TPA: hypothetical protein VGJ70_03845 [Solirubrobacteraceae bacterium]|jgi:predicted amidophosphoribosyltransferase
MDPTAALLALVALTVAMCIGSEFIGVEPTRECPQCGDEVKLSSRTCRGCHYHFP